MRVGIWYFSATGNTAFAAAEFRAAFGPGHPVELHDIEFGDGPLAPGAFERYDVVGFGAPVHAYNAPKDFSRFLSRLPAVKDRPAFLFMVAGQDAEAALLRPARLLGRRGFDVRAATCLYLPGNVGIYHPDGGDVVFRFMGAHRRFVVEEMFEECRREVGRVASVVVNGERSVPAHGAWPRLVSWFLRGPFYGIACPLAHRLLHATAACTLCGLCEQVCPNRVIRVEDGTVRFSGGCTLCARCLNACPKHALRVRWPLRLFNRDEPWLAPGWRPPKH